MEILIPGVGYVQQSRSVQTLIPGVGYYSDPGTSATSILLNGPASSSVGSASDAFTVSADGLVTGTVTVTPSSANGTFSPTSVSLSNATPTATFTYTATSSGSKSITLTNDGGLANPDAFILTALVAPTAEITSVDVSGSTVTISLTTTENPTSGLATLTAAATPNGAVTQGPLALTMGSGTASVVFANVPAGSYSGEVVTVTNAGGTTTATGSTPFEIISMEGGGEGGAPTTDTTAPVMVGSLASSLITHIGFTVSYSAATDAVGVTGYEYRIDGGAYVNAGNVLAISIGGRAPSTLYAVDVRAYDAAGNKATPISIDVTTTATPVFVSLTGGRRSRSRSRA